MGLSLFRTAEFIARRCVYLTASTLVEQFRKLAIGVCDLLNPADMHRELGIVEHPDLIFGHCFLPRKLTNLPRRSFLAGRLSLNRQSKSSVSDPVRLGYSLDGAADHSRTPASAAQSLGTERFKLFALRVVFAATSSLPGSKARLSRRLTEPGIV